MSDFEISGIGRGATIYDDGVARAAWLIGDIYILECAGKAVEFNAAETVEAMTFLVRNVGGLLSLQEAVQAILEHLEARLPAEAIVA